MRDGGGLIVDAECQHGVGSATYILANLLRAALRDLDLTEIEITLGLGGPDDRERAQFRTSWS